VNGRARVQWIEKPDDYADLPDLAVEYLGASGNTTGTVTGTSTPANGNTSGTGVVATQRTSTMSDGVVHVASISTTNITLDNTTTAVSAWTVTNGALVCINGQTTASQNGIYITSTSGAWIRWPEPWQRHRIVHVTEGDYAGYLYELATDGTIVLGTTNIAFAPVVPAAKINCHANATTLLYDNERTSVQIDAATENDETVVTIEGDYVAKAVSDANLDLSGAETIDGENVSTGDVVLAIGQTTGADRDIWVVDSSGAWVRAGIGLRPGQKVRVKGGSIYNTTTWQIAMDGGAITRGTTTVVWRRVDGRFLVYAKGGADLPFTIPNGTSRVLVVVTGTITAAETVTLPAIDADMDGIEVTVQMAGTFGVGGSLAVAAQGVSTISNTPTWGAQWAKGTLVSRGGNWFGL
jgi:hypothetical protein